jgi:uncharacterized protein
MSAPHALAAPVPELGQPTRQSWLWAQTWHDLLFAHWRVDAGSLRRHLPAALEVDTCAGSAWVSVVAFRLHVRRRWLPPLGFWTSFQELNLRTYVRWRGETGIHFLSIHAGKRTSVGLARWLTPLPYTFGSIQYERQAEGMRFECRGNEGHTLFQADFAPQGPLGPPALAADQWLLERYRAFATNRRRRLCGMVAQHSPWLVRAVRGCVTAEHLGRPWGLRLEGQPDTMHFAPRMKAWLGRFAVL